MKYFPMFGSLAMILGCLLTSRVSWASGDGFTLPSDIGPEFLVSNAQGYLGVNLSEIRDRMAALHLKDTHGAEVTLVDHDSPAAKSGLKVHDVILQLDGQTFDTVEQLKQRLREMPPGRKVSLLISRDGNPTTVNVQLCDRAVLEQQAWSKHWTVPEPASIASSPRASTFVGHIRSTGDGILETVLPKGLYVGAELNPVRTQLADYFGVKSGTGLLVENVDYQSPAARAGLKAGDVVVKVDYDPMTSRRDWVKAIRNHRGQMVQVTVMRNKQEQILNMSAGKLKK